MKPGDLVITHVGDVPVWTVLHINAEECGKLKYGDVGLVIQHDHDSNRAEWSFCLFGEKLGWVKCSWLRVEPT